MGFRVPDPPYRWVTPPREVRDGVKIYRVRCGHNVTLELGNCDYIFAYRDGWIFILSDECPGVKATLNEYGEPVFMTPSGAWIWVEDWDRGVVSAEYRGDRHKMYLCEG